jgi:hypothetical protein
MKGSATMDHIIGIAWFKDKAAYRRALDTFADPESMPATFEDWKPLLQENAN